jgi:LysM repeat protein
MSAADQSSFTNTIRSLASRAAAVHANTGQKDQNGVFYGTNPSDTAAFSDYQLPDNQYVRQALGDFSFLSSTPVGQYIDVNKAKTYFGSLASAPQVDPAVAAQQLQGAQPVQNNPVAPAGYAAPMGTGSASTPAPISIAHTVQKGENLTAIAKRYGVSVDDISGYASGNKNLIQPGETLTIKPPGKPGTAPVTNTNSMSGLSTASSPAPTLPTPQGAGASTALMTGLTADVQAQRATLDATYQKQVAELDRQVKASEQKIQELNTAEQNTLTRDVKALTEPFRQKLEDAERQRLSITANFEANQKLVTELESLLTQGNELIKQQKDATGLGSVRNPRVEQTISDVNARAGVIKAVMDARNDQIASAENMIDRSIAAINADRTDQLQYYSTLYDFYENQKDTEGKKLVSLEADKKTYLQSQIKLLESDLERSQTTADYVKDLMMDPRTALTLAQAGVTLNDTVTQINQKIAKQVAVEDKTTLINDMASKGYSYLATAAQTSGKDPSQIVSVRDSQGNTLQFLKPKDPNAGSLGGLSTQERTYLNQIQDNARQDPNIKSFPDVRASYETARSAATTGGGTGDIVLMRMLAKITDPSTGVREEEFKTFESAQSTLARYGIALTKKMWAGDRLSEEGRTQLLSAAEDIYKQREAAYNNSVNFYENQATNGGLPAGSVMPAYTAPSPIQIVGAQIDEALANGHSPGDIINKLLQPDSVVREQVLEAQRNHYSPEQILEHLKKVSSAGNPQTSAKNGGGQEIVAGHDITTYATDPNHGMRVQQIYNQIPSIASASDVDRYIQRVAPGSPVRGQDVIASAQQFGEDPRLMLAIMQQDSSFGTQGLAKKTFNPGNVGNDDSGAENNLGNWSSGVRAVAQELSTRRLS